MDLLFDAINFGVSNASDDDRVGIGISQHQQQQQQQHQMEELLPQRQPVSSLGDEPVPQRQLDYGFGDGNNTLMLTAEQMRLAIEEMAAGSNFDAPILSALVIAYCLLIAVGATGNALVCFVVLANAHMRSPRNVLIVNLAASDLILCLFTQPFNVVKLSMRTWSLGTVLCKLVPTVAGVNVYVSTISITAIALDRFQLIVHPTSDDFLGRRRSAALALALIWIISVLMASPMLSFTVLKPFDVEGMRVFVSCMEDPDARHSTAAYSVWTVVFQYLVPIIVITFAHLRISNKLRHRMATGGGGVRGGGTRGSGGGGGAALCGDGNADATVPLATSSAAEASTSTAMTAVGTLSPFQARRQRVEAARKRKTNLLLLAIAGVFAASWLPLNVLNLMLDFDEERIKKMDHPFLAFAMCHLVALCSACANPVLYGWLNDNFRREFLRVGRVLCRGRCAAVLQDSAAAASSAPGRSTAVGDTTVSVTKCIGGRRTPIPIPPPAPGSGTSQDKVETGRCGTPPRDGGVEIGDGSKGSSSAASAAATAVVAVAASAAMAAAATGREATSGVGTGNTVTTTTGAAVTDGAGGAAGDVTVTNGRVSSSRYLVRVTAEVELTSMSTTVTLHDVRRDVMRRDINDDEITEL